MRAAMLGRVLRVASQNFVFLVDDAVTYSADCGHARRVDLKRRGVARSGAGAESVGAAFARAAVARAAASSFAEADDEAGEPYELQLGCW